MSRQVLVKNPGQRVHVSVARLPAGCDAVAMSGRLTDACGVRIYFHFLRSHLRTDSFNEVMTLQHCHPAFRPDV
jgi:hypothetical protein